MFKGYVGEDGNPISEGVIPNSPSVTSSTAAPNWQPPTTSNGEGGTYPCELSVSQVSVPGFVCKGQLLFEDNFNEDIDDGKIWTPEIKFPGEPVCI